MNSLKTIYNILMCIEKDPAQREKGRAILSGIGEKMVPSERCQFISS